MKKFIQKTDLLVFSLNSWGMAMNRTNQIMSRYAKYRNVWYFEPPVFGVSSKPLYLIRESKEDVQIVEPYLPENISLFEQKVALTQLIDKLIIEKRIKDFSVWCDTPKAMPLVRHLNPSAMIYDCANDYALSNPELEDELFKKTDVVFTSGLSLYAAKRPLHSNIHMTPDSINYRHFYQARVIDEDPSDQTNIPHPRIGFNGMIDETINLGLLKNLAQQKPNWHFIMTGAVKAILEEELPKMPNIHFLGEKYYSKIPDYISGWDCTLLPYKVKEETKFLNPNMIAQSLVGACPVVSTSIKDVVTMYENQNLIQIADTPMDIITEIENTFGRAKYDKEWLNKIDHQFEGMSWELCCKRLSELEHDIYIAKRKQREAGLRKFLIKNFFQWKKAEKAYWAPIMSKKLVNNGQAS